MANVLIARGGRPDFKGWMCEGQWAEYGPPYTEPNMPHTPPFDSHAEAAHGQGYLNLHFPLVPNLDGTNAHRWMQSALRELKAVGDILFTNWVPTRSYLSSLYTEVKTPDAMLDGVYIKPVAHRVVVDLNGDPTCGIVPFSTVPVADFEAEMAAAGITKLPLGTPADGDTTYAIARLSQDPTKKPSTFGHTIKKFNEQTNLWEPLDDYFGAVLLGYEIVEGDAEKIAAIWRSNVAVYLSAKLFTFEGASQIA